MWICINCGKNSVHGDIMDVVLIDKRQIFRCDRHFIWAWKFGLLSKLGANALTGFRWPKDYLLHTRHVFWNPGHNLVRCSSWRHVWSAFPSVGMQMHCERETGLQSELTRPNLALVLSGGSLWVQATRSHLVQQLATGQWLAGFAANRRFLSPFWRRINRFSFLMA